MVQLRFGFLEIDVDILGGDSLALASYVVVPDLVTWKQKKYLIEKTTLGAGQMSRRQNLDIEIAGTGIHVSVGLMLDVERAILEVSGELDVKAFGKSVHGFPVKAHGEWAYPWPKPRPLPIGNGQISHVVVVMMENRSFDNMLGWLYSAKGNRPPLNIPARKTPTYDGLVPERYWCPSDPKDIGKSDDDVLKEKRVYATQRASKPTVPDPDPFEQFRHMNFQLFGTETPTAETKDGEKKDPTATMKGFVVDYAGAFAAKNRDDAKAIMQNHAPDQVPVLSALARNYAVCDRWFASVPCQTWPNRGFVHAGTSCGRVNNLDSDEDSYRPPDPIYYDTPTIFNALQKAGVTWRVYGDSPLPTLTRYQFITQLWDPFLNGHFRGMTAFKADAKAGLLPAYSFVEPDFMITKNDDHPPHDVNAGERFLYEVWEALSTGAAWKNTLLVITFDEHGGCYDHVPPPWTAVKPDNSKAQKPFLFDRYGVRVPAVLVSPWIEPGTVFRAPTSGSGPEYDHTSILATLRDWLGLQRAAKGAWLKSKRIQSAPTLGQVLTRKTARTDLPAIPRPLAVTGAPASEGLNDLQRSIVAAALLPVAVPFHGLPAPVVQAVSQLRSVEDAVALAKRGLGVASARPVAARPPRRRKTSGKKAGTRRRRSR